MAKSEQDQSFDSPSLAVTAIVEFFGGVPALAEAFKTYNMPPISEAAIYKWRERGQIPGEWIVNLVALGTLQRRAFKIDNFIDAQTKKVG
jgi:2-isopropylmalate synthase